MHHVVIGANGSIGHALVEQLARKNLSPLAISRTAPARPLLDASYVQINILQSDALIKLINKNSIVYYAANAPYHHWKSELEPMLDAVIHACRNRGIRFVYIDNVYAYGGQKKVLHESLPYNAQTEKGKLRAHLAEKIMQEHKAGTMEVTIARASDIFGPAVKMATLGEYVVKNLIKSGSASVPVSVTTPHCFNFVNDLACNIITLAQSSIAWGEIWHMPCAKAISIQNWGRLLLTELDKEGDITTMPALVKKILGLFIPPLREYNEMQYEYEQEYELSARKFLKTFSAVITPHVEAVHQTIAWYKNATVPESVSANKREAISKERVSVR